MVFESLNSFYPDYYSYCDLFTMFRYFCSQELGIIFYGICLNASLYPVLKIIPKK
jgi:hypothetical protein